MNYLVKVFVVIAAFSLTTLSSCSDPEPPKATVTVLAGVAVGQTAVNAPLPNVIVTVYIDPSTGKQGFVDPDNGVEKIVKTTNSSGQCDFEFVLENILNVKAELPMGKDTLFGIGSITLTEDETFQEVITLREYKPVL